MPSLTLEDYLKRKKERSFVSKTYRKHCDVCKKPIKTCYCEYLQSVDSTTQFIILMHRDEAKRSVASGRMAHLTLKNSKLFVGKDFSGNEELNRILKKEENYPVLLYPGQKAVPLENLEAQSALGKKLVLILLDATWHEARQMYRLSTNLHPLPMFSFTPETPSGFTVRKQPKFNCYSTIEAIHHVLKQVEPHGKYDKMLKAFEYMVQTQLSFWSAKI